MPPWKPTRGVGPKLKHDQSLNSAELAVLSAWADAGAPRGDPKDLPPPPTFRRGLEARAARPDPRPGRVLPRARRGP